MRHALRLPAFLALLACAATHSRAGISPEGVLVVVNGDSWASLTVANEYARLRHIPPGNFVVLQGLSATDFTDAQRFRDEILKPVFKAIDDRALRGQIDCITYSLDLPCAVAVNGDMAGKTFGQTTTPVASANGLTYLHEWFLKSDADYLRLDINLYARRALPLAQGAPLTSKEQAEYQRGMKLYDQKDYAGAAAAIGALAAVKKSNPEMLYNLACCLALAGRGEESLAALTSAADAGWRNHGQTAGDTDFASIRDRAEFKALLTRMKEAKVRVQPTIGFSARRAWSPAGEPVESGGPHYMLSTMLGVASGRGNSVGEVLECLKRAAAADGTNPRGTVYMEKNGDVRSTTREWAFPFACEELTRLGVAAVIEDGVLPKGKRDVAGGVIGISDFNWGECKSTILPGAIVEHLTSCGGMMGERDGQTPCTEFIRAGAAGSSGAVTEPYALQAKFPDAFVHAHYARGSTLAEAFYQSLQGPYQLLIIGDPLCRPWTGKGSSAGKVSLAGLTPGTPLKGEASLKPAADAGVARFELYVDGRLHSAAGPGEAFTLDTAALPDGEHTLSAVAVHKDALESRTRGEFAVRIANSDRAVKVIRKPAAAVVFGQKLTLELACEGAAGFDVEHLGRVVAHADGAKATIEIDSARLGTGRVQLRPVALGTHKVQGPSVEFEITPPAVIPAWAGPAPANVAKGLSLSIAGGPATVVADTFDPAWIAVVPAGKTFEATGVFEIPASPKPELFQIQLRTSTGAVIEFDGVKLLSADRVAAAAWCFAPARLAPGRHTLRVTGTAPATAPMLDLRLGLAGTQHAGNRQFTCTPGKK